MFGDAAERLNKLEQVVAAYYRRDPVDEANHTIQTAAEEFARWQQAALAEINAAAADLERQLAAIREIETQIGGLDQRLEQDRPNLQDAASVERFNERVGERNALVARQKELSQAYERQGQAHDERVRSYNAEAERRRNDADAAQKAARERFEAYRAWANGRRDERFYQELNQLYGWLRGQARTHPERAGELNAYVAQLRSLRGEVAAHARMRQEKAENGVLILAAILCEAEEVFLVVDTGSQTVTITPELVEALGLADKMGEDVEVGLPGGIRTHGRKLTLPRVSVMGMQADQVEAIVLPEPQVGVDGLLGLSYLNHFNYEVVKERPQRLRLIPRDAAPEQDVVANGAYDVFISHRSEDAWWSHVVFDALTVMGYRPFLSEVSLRDRGRAEFRREIDAALSSARHLIVVASCAANMKADWVEAEWGLFLTEKRAGRKQGNLISVVCGAMTAEDVPMPLSAYQAVPVSDLGWRAMLRDFLPR